MRGGGVADPLVRANSAARRVAEWRGIWHGPARKAGAPVTPLPQLLVLQVLSACYRQASSSGLATHRNLPRLSNIDVDRTMIAVEGARARPLRSRRRRGARLSVGRS